MNFKKVSKQQFEKDCTQYLNDAQSCEAISQYELIEIPKRKTTYSAGYDFVLPFSFTLAPHENIVIPTGICANMRDDVVLIIAPRSGLGVRYRLQLANTIGIIDSDYINSDNEGHILITLTNDSNEGKVLNLTAGDSFVQGIFLNYLLTDDDDVCVSRQGGFGSTDKKIQLSSKKD